MTDTGEIRSELHVRSELRNLRSAFATAGVSQTRSIIETLQRLGPGTLRRETLSDGSVDLTFTPKKVRTKPTTSERQRHLRFKLNAHAVLMDG